MGMATGVYPFFDSSRQGCLLFAVSGTKSAAPTLRFSVYYRVQNQPQRSRRTVNDTVIAADASGGLVGLDSVAMPAQPYPPPNHDN